MQSFAKAVFFAAAGLCIASQSFAHSFSAAAPAHVSVSHGAARGYAVHRGTPYYLNGVLVVPGATAGAYGGAADAYGEAMPAPEKKVQSDAERYRAATGQDLPPVHGLVTVAPASSKEDGTYIWANKDSD